MESRNIFFDQPLLILNSIGRLNTNSTNSCDKYGSLTSLENAIAFLSENLNSLPSPYLNVSKYRASFRLRKLIKGECPFLNEFIKSSFKSGAVFLIRKLLNLFEIILFDFGK